MPALVAIPTLPCVRSMAPSLPFQKIRRMKRILGLPFTLYMYLAVGVDLLGLDQEEVHPARRTVSSTSPQP